MKIHNCHSHIFRLVDVPKKFLPFGLVRMARSRVGSKILSGFLRYLNPFRKNDALDRLAKFMATGNMKSQREILDSMRQHYPKGSRFVVLTMDMNYMGAGKTKRPYSEQIGELSGIKATLKDTVIPFIHIDPRREGYYDVFRAAVDELGFEGVKIYPPLGYYPYDTNLQKVYSYCEKKGIPILTHCSSSGPVYYKGRKKKLRELLKRSIHIKPRLKGSKKELCSQFTDPRNWEPVLKAYPKLKVCLAHFGGDGEWEEHFKWPKKEDNWYRMIRNLIAKYPSLYTDVSFVMFNKKFWPILKVILEDKRFDRKVLFGSDYYMVQTETREKQFSMELRAYLGEDLYKRIAEINPKSYLKLKPKSK